MMHKNFLGQYIHVLRILSRSRVIYYLTVNMVDVIKAMNLLDFCENLLENLLESPTKSKSKSAATPDPLI